MASPKLVFSPLGVLQKPVGRATFFVAGSCLPAWTMAMLKASEQIL